MFFDRPAPGSKAMLVFIRNKTSDLATHEEVEELARSAGMAVVGLIESARRDPHPKTMVGSGKVDEIKVAAEAAGANLVLFSEDLSSTQERNLEGALDLRVLGRTGLILEIFAQRARTHEGKLQVELAQLEHSASRLVRGWTHLDRQRGGAGAGLGGAGETQLEADQRLLAARNKKIKERLERVQRQRHQSRRARARSETATVALAGYTNAGKSTLFRLITGQEVPDSGEIEIGETVRLGFVDQSRDDLDPNKNVWEEISGGADFMKLGKHETPTRAYVGAFNFKGTDQQKKVGLLSGGERNRVHMAKMLKQGGNVLLLDEPTNDLDVETLSALEEALESFAGCAVVISHDRFFLDRLATHILAFEGDSHVEWFEGNFESYEEDKIARLGDEATRPHRATYKKMTR